MIPTPVVAPLLGVCGYLLGSFPTGYLLGRWIKGIDIRDHGSGSTGATNVLRTLGKPAGIAVLAIDALKGALAIALVNAWQQWGPAESLAGEWFPWAIVLAAFGAVIGHSRSIFLNFTGGKSVATSLGVLLVMMPTVALATLGVFLILLGITRIVSLSSISGAIAVVLFSLMFQQPLPYILFGAIAGTYVIVRHRTNIQRLLQGTEPRLGQKIAPPTSPS